MKKVCLTSKVRKKTKGRKSVNSLFNFWGTTRKRGCSSAGRAPALQAGGHRFDPVHLHHFRKEEGQENRIPVLTQNGLIAQVVRAHA